MTNREITALALKVFAIYILVHVLIGLPGIYGMYLAARGQVGVYEVPLIPLLIVFGTYIAAFLLVRMIWKLSKNIVVAVGDGENTKLPDDVSELVIMSIGLFITIGAVFTFTSAVYEAFREMVTYERSGGLSGSTFVWALSEFLKGILGVTLMIRPRGWIGVFKKLRTLGRE